VLMQHVSVPAALDFKRNIFKAVFVHKSSTLSYNLGDTTVYHKYGIIGICVCVTCD
jgi:hypothetical protein